MYARYIQRLPFLAILTVCALAPASAHRRDFAFTYEWWTAAKGEKEIEVWNTYAPNEKAYQGQVEFETGITDRSTGSLSLVDEKEEGEKNKVGAKVETRYRFGDFAEGKVLPAAYFEVEKMSAEPAELEGKGIFSRYVGDKDLSLNLIVTRPLESGAETDIGYALGYSVGTKMPNLRLGLEAIGSFKDSTHGIGPVAAMDIGMSTRAVLGANFGLTHGIENQVRLLVEYEFF